MKNPSDKILSLQTAALQGLYWMTFCPIYCFSSVFLLSKDFTNQQIGWLIAISNILAVFFQPYLGSLIDRIEKLTIKLVISVLSLVSLVLLSLLIFLDTSLLGISILFIGTALLLITIMPLVTSVTFEYINAGHKVSFGLTRSVGSLSFAVLSTLVGIWVKQTSPDILPILSAILLVCFILLVFTLPGSLRHEKTALELQSAEEQRQSPAKGGFLRRYDRFLPFLIGAACLFVFHTVINTFLAQIITSVGGETTDLGVSLTIAAVCEVPAFLAFNYFASKSSTGFLLKLSGITYALRSIIFLFASSVWMINIGQVFQLASYGFFTPGSVYFVNQMMKGQDKVKGQTFITGASTLGGVVASITGGWLLDQHGVPALLSFGVFAAIAGCLLMIVSIRKKPALKAG